MRQIHSQIGKEILNGRHARKTTQNVRNPNEKVDVLNYIRQITPDSEGGSTVTGTTSPNRGTTSTNRDTTYPNTDNDKSTTSNTAETQPTSVSDSDEYITVKIMNDMLSDLEWSEVTKREKLLQTCVPISYIIVKECHIV